MKKNTFRSILIVILLVNADLLGALNGFGTALEPYLIQNEDDFYEFLDTANASMYWAEGVKVKLMCDIDLAGVLFNNSLVSPDTSAQNGFQGQKYFGEFDGNGYTIKNLTIVAVDKDYIGFIGYAGKNSKIKNLTLQNATIQGRSYVGGMIGFGFRGAIQSCKIFGGSISGSKYFVGGLAGFVGRNEIAMSNVNADVSGFSSIGGLAGDTYLTTITKCCYTGNVNISNSSHYAYVGGLAGSLSNSNLYESYSQANIFASGDSLFVGGLTGINYFGQIGSCYAKGNIQSDTGAISFLGGLAGILVRGEISYSYFSSGIAMIQNGASAGAIVADSVEGLVESCFWDITTSNQLGSPFGKGLPTSEMMSISVYAKAGWNQKGWVINDGIDYPRLNWEQTAGIEIPESAFPPFLGSGTIEDPYQICSSQDFYFLSWQPSLLDKHFKLMTDLDLGGFSLYPIGDLGESFSGTFDGNGYCIRNISISQPKNDYIGIFKVLGTSGQIKNLRIENIYVEGKSFVGGLVGKTEPGSQITSCYLQGQVKGNGHFVGGLIGQNTADIVSECNVNIVVNGTGDCVGGLIGDNLGNLTYCNSNGTVRSFGDYVGGLIGVSSSKMVFSCSSRGHIEGKDYSGGLVGYVVIKDSSTKLSYCDFSGSVRGNSYVGGIAGCIFFGFYSQYPTNPNVDFCSSSGSVDGSLNVGGVFGCCYNGAYSSSLTHLITRCYANTDVNGSVNVGGVIGSNGFYEKNFWGYESYSWPVRIMQCYAAGHIVGIEKVGGIVGGQFWGIQENYWDVEKSGKLSASGVGNITQGGRTSLEMKIVSTYKNWDFYPAIVDGDDVDWIIPYNTPDGYPKFAWQADPGVPSFSGGVGTPSKPYLISTYLDFIDFLNSPSIWDRCFRLTSDIDFGTITLPISPIFSFPGDFDGNGKTIKSLKISDTSSDNVGLFRKISNAGRVKNLALELCEIAGRSNVGGLVGINEGNIAGCYVKGRVQGSGTSVGGIFGKNSGIIDSCYTACVVSTSGSIVGGFGGENTGVVQSSYSVSSVSSANQAGGFIGFNKGFVSASYWDIDISGMSFSSGGKGLSSNILKNKTTYLSAGWDFVDETFNGTNDMWRLCKDGISYPRLRWEFDRIGDFSCPDGVALEDIASLSQFWMSDISLNGAADKYDLNRDEQIALEDLIVLINNWLYGISITIEISNEGNGFLVPSGTIYTNVGESVQITSYPQEGWRTKAWLVDDIQVASKTNSFTFTPTSIQHMVKVLFEPIPIYKVTIRSAEHGIVNPNGIVNVLEGNSINITAVPDNYYVIDTWFINGNPISLKDPNLKIEDIDQDYDVYITFRPITFAEALDNNLIWQTYGFNTWQIDHNFSYCGSYSVRSGNIPDLEQTYIQTRVVGPGTLTFWWRVSSELGYDFLNFYIDYGLVSRISGEQNWNLVSVKVPYGEHLLRWSYTKDISLSNGFDCGWIDNISFIPE